jgi:O-antigen/teichoic acid export membrane protein
MDNTNRLKVTQGAIYLYVENIAAMVSGYVFWLVISRLTTPEVVGTAAAVISLSAIASTIITLGVPISVQRFLGKTFLNQKYGEAREYISASILLLVIVVILSSFFFFILGRDIMNFSEIEFTIPLLVITNALIISSAFGRLFRGIIIASLKTKILVAAGLLSTVSKFSVSILLIFVGMQATGLTIGITSYFVVETIVMGLTVLALFNKSRSQKSDRKNLKKIKQVLVGGMPAWLPAVVTSLGTQLGTLLVFGWQGSSEAGFYYIAYSIYAALAAVVGVIFSITFPVLSAMEKGHSSFSWKVIKISLILSLPFSFCFVFYPKEILSFFGDQYVSAANSLVVLTISLLPITIMGGITNLLYARGHYREAMIIGIATSLPRALIYFFLVPIFGGLGSAIAFTIGSIVGLSLALMISRKTDMKIIWKQICLISCVPIVIPFVYSLFPLGYVFAIPLSVLTAYLIYFRLNLPTRSELSEFLSVMPPRIGSPILKVYDVFNRKNAG